MAVTALTWKQTIWPRLRQFLQVQQVLVFLGVLFYALFTAVKVHAPLAFLMVCILVLGNANFALQSLSSRIYGKLPFPWNWVLYLPVLAGVSIVSVLAAIALLRWMVAIDQPFWRLFHETWQIGMVLSMGTGIVGYGAVEVQRRLREKNSQLEQAVAKGAVVIEQQEVELRRALEIQRGLLPKELPQLPGVELAGAWQPARTVGGDYFDVLQLDDHRLGICVGDVAGKGLTASLLMANLQAAFRAYATPEASPATVCTRLNAFVCGNVAPGKFITFFYAILDTKNLSLTYENAGHCPGLLLRAAGSAEALSGQGGVLGVIPEWTYFDSKAHLAPGDRFLIFTDGVTEAENSDAIEFGSDRVAQAAGTASHSAADTKRRVLESVTAFCSGEFHDDVTLVVAAIR